MCTDVITHHLHLRNVWVINYLDDYIGVTSPSNASNAFQTLTNILQAVGLPINQKKIEKPGEQVTCLGIEINARTNILKIPENKMLEVKEMCSKWMNRTHASRHQLQKLTGKLLYIHRCFRPARLFVNCVLGVLCNTPVRGTIQLPQSFFKDIMWFQKFLKYFNSSVEIFPRTATRQQVYVDASLQRVGGMYGTRVYTCPIPSLIQHLCSIIHFEAINIVLTIRNWHQCWANRSIIIWCDNWAVVNAFQSNQIKDIWLMAAVRTVWLYTAAFNIDLQVKHIKGVQNTYADILSRWHTYEASELSPVRVLKQCNW